MIPRKDGKATSDDGGYQLTSLVESDHFRDPSSTVLKVNRKYFDWEVADAKPRGANKSYKFLRLFCYVNWYLSELDKTVKRM